MLHFLNREPPTQILPAFNYLILRFDERGKSVISRAAINHLLPYLPKRKKCFKHFFLKKRWKSTSGRRPKFRLPTSTLMSFSISASRKSSVTGSLNLAVCREVRENTHLRRRQR